MSAAETITRAMTDPLVSGIPVTWIGGWANRMRTYATLQPRGFVCHHTGTSRRAAGDYPSLAIVRDGRSDLPGPLSQFGLGRSGRIYIIAGGTANHAGPGGWRGLSGNSSVFGCEAENDGIGEPWSPAQIDAYLRLIAACARAAGFGPEMVCRHAEWSNMGKTDTATAPLDNGDWIRMKVADLLANRPIPPAPPPPPPPPPRKDSSLMLIYWSKGRASLLLASGKTVWITSPNDLTALRAAGIPEAKGDLSDAQLAEFAK